MLSVKISCFGLRKNTISTTKFLARSALLSKHITKAVEITSEQENKSIKLTKRIKINKLAQAPINEIVGMEVCVKGWVRTVRDQKKFFFVEINDGSSLTGIQAVVESDNSACNDVTKYILFPLVESWNSNVLNISGYLLVLPLK